MLDTLFAVGVGFFTTLATLRFFRHGMPFVIGVLAYFLFEGFYNQFEWHLKVFFVVLVLMAILARFTPEPLRSLGPPGIAALLAVFEGNGRLLPTLVSLGGVAAYAVFMGVAHARATTEELRKARRQRDVTVLAVVLALTFMLTKSLDMYLFMLYTSPLTGFLLYRRMPAPWVVSSVMVLNFAFLARALH